MDKLYIVQHPLDPQPIWFLLFETTVIHVLKCLTKIGLQKTKQISFDQTTTIASVKGYLLTFDLAIEFEKKQSYQIKFMAISSWQDLQFVVLIDIIGRPLC